MRIKTKNLLKTMKTNHVISCSTGGLHKLAYTEWGNTNNSSVLICAHGLTRNKRDFDIIAEHLSSDYRVICYDFAGRGDSDWLNNKLDYNYAQYVVDAMVIISRTGVEKVTWLGTSMGGLLGMMLASMDKSPIKRLILNDVGPFVSKQALVRIADYVGRPPAYNNADELECYIRITYAGLGDLSHNNWKHLLKYGQRELEDGSLTLNYDPDISQAFTKIPLDDINLWALWGLIKQPCLVIRGQQSDLLSADTVELMTTTGPCAEYAVIENAGHAPGLMDENQLNIISNWLHQLP